MLLQIHNSFIHVETPQIIQMEIIKSDNVKYQHWNFILKQTKQAVNYLEKKKTLQKTTQGCISFKLKTWYITFSNKTNLITTR